MISYNKLRTKPKRALTTQSKSKQPKLSQNSAKQAENLKRRPKLTQNDPK